MVFGLASLPTEILDLILSHPSQSYLAINLWKTGDSRIIAKLASGLTCLCLSAKSELKSPLPKILGSLHALRTLELTSRVNLVESPEDWRSIIASLPETLKALIIDSKDSIFAVLNFATNLRSFIQYITTVYKRGPSNFIDLGVLFPQLETLVLKGYPPNSKSPFCYSDFDDEHGENCPSLYHYAGVPDTVTHLGFPEVVIAGGADLKLSTMLPSLLPPSLTFLDTIVFTDYEDMSEQDIQRAWNFPHLERIKSLEWLDDDLDDLSWLPRTLKQCSFQSFSRNGEYLTLAMARTLPPALESLDLSSFDEDTVSEFSGDWLSVLPKHLTSLKMTSFLPLNVPHLPRHLKSLKCTLDLEQEAQQDGKVNRETLDWPPLLTYLDVSLSGIGKGVLRLLPHTLTNLKIYARDDTVQLDGRHLPPVVTFSITVKTSLIITGPLPTSLMHFHSVARMTASGCGLPMKCIAMLPPSLTYLDARLDLSKGRSGLLTPSSPIALPPNLVTFKTNEFHIAWFPTLPRSLRHLTVKSVHRPSKITSTQVSTLFSGLPALETIALNTDQDDRFSGAMPFESLGSLPSSLKWVNIPTYKQN